MDTKINALSNGARAVAERIHSLRDFLEFLSENGQCITWPDQVMPEPDIRNVAVAAGRDAMNGPAIIFDRITGYPGKRVVVGVHGSFTNLALLLGYPKSTTIKELFYEIVGRWGADKPLINRVEPGRAAVHAFRVERNINLYELLPLYRINEYDGGFYIAKACIVSRDPRDPDDFNKQNVGIYRIQVHGPDRLTIIAVRNRFAGFAKSAAMRALGTPHGMLYLKNLILVDADVDPFDLNQVMWALSTRTRASDIIVIPNMPMVIVDPAAEVPGKGHRLIIDATSHMPPDPVGADAKIVTPPTGKEIDDLARRIRTLQGENHQ